MTHWRRGRVLATAPVNGKHVALQLDKHLAICYLLYSILL